MHPCSGEQLSNSSSIYMQSTYYSVHEFKLKSYKGSDVWTQHQTHFQNNWTHAREFYHNTMFMFIVLLFVKFSMHYLVNREAIIVGILKVSCTMYKGNVFIVCFRTWCLVCFVQASFALRSAKIDLTQIVGNTIHTCETISRDFFRYFEARFFVVLSSKGFKLKNLN